MAYRDELTALSARHDALSTEVAAKTRELEESRRLLDQARAQARLPVLDNIRVASPCTADWNQMTGDDRTRHCGECKKNVYNLSGMTRSEAEALLIERNGDLCVRYFQRQDGTILLADCTVGVKRRNRRRLIAAGAATLLVSGAAAAHALSRPTCQAETPVMGQTVMGEVARVEPTVSPLETTPTAPSSQGQVAMGATRPAVPPIAPAIPSKHEGRWLTGKETAEPSNHWVVDVNGHEPTTVSQPRPKMGKLVRSR